MDKARSETKAAGKTPAPPQEVPRQALRRLRLEVWKMQQVTDIDRVLLVIGAVLIARQISFLAYSVNVIEEPEGAQPVRVYLHSYDGEQIQAMLDRDHVATPIILEAWKTAQVLYRPDLARENVYQEHLEHDEVRSAIDVPFSRGTLALASGQPEAFAEEDILFFEEISEVLESGFQRLEDLSALQGALRREEALGRLRSRILAMRHLEDLRGELEISWLEELRRLGIPVQGVSLQHPVGEGRFFSQSIFNRNSAPWLAVPVDAMDHPRLADFPWVKQTWESGQPVVVDRSGLEQSGKVGPETQSLLEVPLPGEGSIGLSSRHPAAFGPEAVRTVQLFVGLIAEGLLRLRDFAALEQSEFFFRETQRAAAIGSYKFDFTTGKWDSSEVMEAIFGVDPGVDRRIQDWLGQVHPEDREMISQYLAEEIVGTRKPFAKEYRILRQHDGETRWVYGLGAAAFDPSGTLLSMIGTVQDITERKHLEQEAIRSQRLRAMGELAAGICHNLNNLLTGVLVPAEILQRTVPDPKVQELSGIIVEAGTRAADLVERLRQAVRGTTTDEPLVAMALNQMIEGVLAMTRPKWKDELEARGQNIEVCSVLAELPPIKADPSELHDLLINLLLNAVEALPAGGRIVICTSLDGQFVQLDFGDTGIGMDEATRLRVFEPFFTTKMDVGSGLGMSTLHNSVTRWGGTVAVASTLGKGTTFTLRLPVWQEAETAPAPSAALASRPGRVVVVEDDPVIGRILIEALSVKHQVEVFTDGREALVQFSAGKYDVAILDLGMPGIPGDQVAQRMLAIDPALGRILFSGWVLDEGDSRRKLFDFVLTKPLRDLRAFMTVVAQAIALRDQRQTG